MKHLLLTIIYTLLFAKAFVQLDSCGLDKNPKLNHYEAEYLNNYLKEQRGEFDFTNKLIIYVTGPAGSQTATKTDYFADLKKRDSTNLGLGTTLFLFTNEERVKSGGYDGILTYWVKVLTNRRKNKIIEELGKLNGK